MMEDATFIYQNRSDGRFFDASSRRMRGGPDKLIVYFNGVLCTMDREAKVMIPVSRWQLAEIGLACFRAALRRKRTVTRPVKPAPLPESSPQALPEPRPEATEPESAETQWERLMREMRDLSR
jgi:hypothetical protein